MSRSTNSYTECVICKIKTPAIHKHHVIPRSCGGDDSWIINLCGQCHTCLHSHASFLTAKSKHRLVPSFWLSEAHENIAAPYVEQIVAAIVRTRDTKIQRKYSLPLTIDTTTFLNIKKLQSDLNMSSLQKTVMFCINQELKKQNIL